MSQLTNIDLNLLVAFDALIAERSVTKAARRVALTQSGMSRALSRLRESFDDPLFVRTKLEMVPTPRAEELSGPIRDTLRAFEAVLTQARGFELGEAKRRFVLAGDDHAASWLMAPLVAEVVEGSAQVQLEVLPVAADVFDRLEDGSVDLVLLPTAPMHRPALRMQRLVKDGYACVVAESHAMAEPGASALEGMLASRQVVVCCSAQVVEEFRQGLAEAGSSSEVAAVLPGVAGVADLVRGGGVVATMPARLAAQMARRRGMVRVPVPFTLPELTTYQCWHGRYDTDPGHRWLRSAVKNTALRL